MNFSVYPLLTTDSLIDLHDCILRALRKDDALPEGRKRYGVREFPDWRQHAEAIETELKKRDIDCPPIPW